MLGFWLRATFCLVYGASPCSWSGGRPSAVRSPLDGGLIDAYFTAYAQFGVRCALTFSKLAVDEKDYDNEYNNMLLDYVEKYDGQVILFDDGLARYIKRSRPRIAIVASLNKAMCNLQDSRESESDYYRDLFRLYDEVVVRSEYVLRDGWLDDLRDRRDSVEIIVNQFCVPGLQTCFQSYQRARGVESSRLLWRGAPLLSFGNRILHRESSFRESFHFQ